MVVKPLQALVRTEDGNRLVQPGVKCRGREYLRIIYGPEYTRPEQLAGLRQRNLGRKDNVFSSLDFRLTKNFPVGKYTIQPAIDVFNLLNSKNFHRPEVTNLIFNFDGTVQSGTVTLPAALNTANTSVIWAQSQYTYTPTIGYVITGPLTLHDQIYMRPRLSDTVACNAC